MHVLPLLVSAALAGMTSVVVAQGSSLPPSQVVQCYVCGVSSDMFPGQPPPPPCTTELPPSLRTCPSDHQGCLTTYDGHTIVRTCERFVLDECQVANAKVYCYCKGGKCNTHGLELLIDKLSRAETMTIGTLQPTDDEDHDDRMESGSGNFENDSEGDSGEVDSRSQSATEGQRTRMGTTSKESDLFLSSSDEDTIVSITTPTSQFASQANPSHQVLWGVAVTLIAGMWMQAQRH